MHGNEGLGFVGVSMLHIMRRCVYDYVALFVVTFGEAYPYIHVSMPTQSVLM